MTIPQANLELFAALPDHGTLGSAARSLHVSESGLSHALTELETAIGEQLCVRRKARGMTLTPAGQYLASRAREIVKEVESLTADLGQVRGEMRGPVSLGCYAGLAGTVLPPLLQGFGQLNPGVAIGITVGDHADLLPALQDGELDVAILYDIDLSAGLKRQVIYDAEVVAVLPATSPFAEQSAVNLAHLAPLPIIVLDTSPSAEYTDRMFTQRGLVPNIGAKVPQPELVRAMVARGLGYSLLMSRPGQGTVSGEGLTVAIRPLCPRSGLTSVVAVWSADVRLNGRAQAVVDFTTGMFNPKKPDIPDVK